MQANDGASTVQRTNGPINSCGRGNIATYVSSRLAATSRSTMRRTVRSDIPSSRAHCSSETYGKHVARIGRRLLVAERMECPYRRSIGARTLGAERYQRTSIDCRYGVLACLRMGRGGPTLVGLARSNATNSFVA